MVELGYSWREADLWQNNRDKTPLQIRQYLANKYSTFIFSNYLICPTKTLDWTVVETAVVGSLVEDAEAVV